MTVLRPSSCPSVLDLRQPVSVKTWCRSASVRAGLSRDPTTALSLSKGSRVNHDTARIRRLLGAQSYDTEYSTVSVARHDQKSPRRPFVCRDASRSERGNDVHRCASMRPHDLAPYMSGLPRMNENVTRTAPLLMQALHQRGLRLGTQEANALATSRQTRSKFPLGEILTLDDGTSRMQVDGFVDRAGRALRRVTPKVSALRQEIPAYTGCRRRRSKSSDD